MKAEEGLYCGEKVLVRWGGKCITQWIKGTTAGPFLGGSLWGCFFTIFYIQQYKLFLYLKKIEKEFLLLLF